MSQIGIEAVGFPDGKTKLSRGRGENAKFTGYPARKTNLRRSWSIVSQFSNFSYCVGSRINLLTNFAI